MKLIKINTDHYVVVDDSEIKEGDWFIGSDNKILLCKKTILGLLYSENDYGRNKNGCKKITHSTQPLEYDEDNTYTYDKVKYIPLSYIKELIGEVDVEEKAIECFKPELPKQKKELEWNGFIKGYKQALEDNKEKKYTEEDMKYMFECGRNFQSNGESTFTISILHIEPKTDWEVEFVDGKLKLK